MSIKVVYDTTRQSWEEPEIAPLGVFVKHMVPDIIDAARNEAITDFKMVWDADTIGEIEMEARDITSLSMLRRAMTSIHIIRELSEEFIAKQTSIEAQAQEQLRRQVTLEANIAAHEQLEADKHMAWVRTEVERFMGLNVGDQDDVMGPDVFNWIRFFNDINNFSDDEFIFFNSEWKANYAEAIMVGELTYTSSFASRSEFIFVMRGLRMMLTNYQERLVNLINLAEYSKRVAAEGHPLLIVGKTPSKDSQRAPKPRKVYRSMMDIAPGELGSVDDEHLAAAEAEVRANLHKSFSSGKQTKKSGKGKNNK